MPPDEILPDVLIITPRAKGNYSFPPAAFFRKSVSPPPQQKEGGTMALSSLLNKKDPGTTNHAFEEREVFSSRHLPAQS